MLATAVLAQAPTAPESGRAQQLFRGSKIIGSTVRDAQQKKIGEIKDLVLDSGRGEVIYAIVDFGDIAGRGKVHPVPWQALEPGDNGGYYVLHADRETIIQAPGFDHRHWPDMADRRWSGDVERYWNRTVGRGMGGRNRLTDDAGRAGGAQTKLPDKER
jgi:hypothetical protein